MNVSNDSIYILFICIAVPVIMLTVLVGKKPRGVLAFMVVGMYVCLFSANVSGFLRDLLNEDMLYLTTTVTPIVEECLKFLVVLFYALFISNSKGKIYTVAAAVGLGFALLENTFVLMNYGSPSILWALARGFGSGLMHVICTATVGNGLASIRNNRKMAISNTFALLTAAIIYHSIYNALVKSSMPWLGVVLTVVTFALVFLFVGRLYPNLREEIKKRRERQ